MENANKKTKKTCLLFYSTVNKKLADVDADGSITIADVTELLNILAK